MSRQRRSNSALHNKDIQSPLKRHTLIHFFQYLGVCMKTSINIALALLCIIALSVSGCQSNAGSKSPEGGLSGGAGQAAVVDTTSAKDIVKVAIASADHSTLVKAVTAADLVNSLSNAGPFTVFAPTNAAFEKLPQGTVENLLKTENQSQLVDILQHHVAVAVYEADALKDGQILGMVDGNNATIHRKDGALYIDDAKVLASVRASNGIIHVIDAVVLAKK